MYVSSDRDAVNLLQEELAVVNQLDILRTVENGFDLIRFLEDVKTGDSYPDLIILSKKMARLSGHEILELLKTDDIYRLIPVIMLVPEDNEEDNTLCNRMGAEMMTTPTQRNEWASAAKKFCAACG
jgi:CheY-like chemotaxis protein